MIALANQIKYSFSNVIRKILINADHTTVIIWILHKSSQILLLYYVKLERNLMVHKSIDIFKQAWILNKSNLSKIILW